jgi:hypothetical protein
MASVGPSIVCVIEHASPSLKETRNRFAAMLPGGGAGRWFPIPKAGADKAVQSAIHAIFISHSPVSRLHGRGGIAATRSHGMSLEPTQAQYVALHNDNDFVFKGDLNYSESSLKSTFPWGIS